MKRIFLIISVLMIFSLETSFAAETLKPSISAQMQYQNEVNKKLQIAERMMKNKERLAALRSKNTPRNTTISSTPSTPTKGTNNQTPPKIIIASNTSNITSSITGVDMTRVRSTWLSWYNDYRQSLGLGLYSYDTRLDQTAHDWNIEFAKGKGQNHHRRNASDSYYDFPVIDAWFTARGISPKVINRSKNTENVGYGYYSCNQSDCTDELISSIRSTYDFFMSEKGKSYDAHYRSIVNPYFTKIGVDIIVEPSERRYYMTIHYITE